MSTTAFRPEEITAVILAGGAGTRLGGVDKARLIWRERWFIEHSIERLQRQAARVVINSNRPRDHDQLGLAVVGDAGSQRRGPLAGVLAALTASTTPFTLVVPCDCPQLSLQLAERLQRELITECADIAYAITGTDDHYLFALLRAALRPNLAAHLTEPGSGAVYRWYAGLRCARVDFSDQPECFFNVNTPDDLDRLP